jgi:predicted double-glycine peptidase
MNRHALLIGLAAGLAARLAMAGAVELPYQIGGAYSVRVASIREARFAATIRQQYDFSCGSAAVATLLTHHYKYPVTEDKVFEAMFVNGDQAKIRVEGFSLLDMKHYLEAQGFEADGFQEPIEKLATANIPAIVLVNESGYNHFVVVKGLRDGRVLVGDPAGGTRALTLSAFNAIWTNQILFVISNRQDSALFNVASDWQTAPTAPIRSAIGRDGLGGVVIPKLGPADF